MTKKWISNAKWLVDGKLLIYKTTTDMHDTEEQAQAVCDRLIKEYSNHWNQCPVRGVCVSTWVTRK